VESSPSSTLWLRLTGQDVSEARWTVFKYRWQALLFLLLLICVPGAVLTLKTLSPLALAFLAGYAVELIFTAMDRIVGAFSGGRPGDRAAKGPAGNGTKG